MTVMLYKYPGQHEIHGDKFDYIVVESNEVELKLSEGWHLTTPEAKNAKAAAEKAAAEKAAAEKAAAEKAAAEKAAAEKAAAEKAAAEKAAAEKAAKQNTNNVNK